MRGCIRQGLKVTFVIHALFLLVEIIHGCHVGDTFLLELKLLACKACKVHKTCVQGTARPATWSDLAGLLAIQRCVAPSYVFQDNHSLREYRRSKAQCDLTVEEPSHYCLNQRGEEKEKRAAIGNEHSAVDSPARDCIHWTVGPKVRNYLRKVRYFQSLESATVVPSGPSRRTAHWSSS
jgi:hypothetical protein